MTQSGTHIAREGRLVGRGSEAVVHLDRNGRSVHKRFDRAPIAVARAKAINEYELLTEAAAHVSGHDRIHVPAPISLDEDSASFQMSLATGTPLLEFLRSVKPASETWLRLVDDVAEGLFILGPLQSDMSPDHILVNTHEGATFLDFGNGASGLEGITRGTAWDAFIELCAATVYECARPSAVREARLFPVFRTFFEDVGMRLAGLLQVRQNSKNASVSRLPERVKEGASGRVGSTGFARKLWYAARIPTVASTVTPALSADLTVDRESSRILSAHQPVLRHVHSFVWDFPAENEPLANGVHKVVDGLSTSLSKRDLTVSVHAFGRSETSYVRNGYRVHIHARSGMRIPKSLKALLGRDVESSVLVLNGAFNTLSTRVARIARRRGMRYVVTPHMMFSDALMQVSRHKKWPFWLAFERTMFRKAAALAVYSLEQKVWFARHGVNTHLIESINGPCDPVLPKTDHYSTEGPIRFHFFGRITEQTKGLDLLISAVSRISADNSLELSFTLQGPDNGDQARLQTRIDDLGLSDVIRFKEPATYPNPVLIMADYDVCILPSRYEGFPTSLVEAMMAARPIVCTRVGALAPMLENEGSAVVVNSTVEGIERGIREIIARRSEWRTMGLELRAFVDERLDWDRIATQWHVDVAALFNGEVSDG